ESAQEPVFFIKERKGRKLHALMFDAVLAPQGFTPEQVLGFEPMDSDQKESLVSQSTRLGDPSLSLGEDDFYAVNDATVADVVQSTYDWSWEQANGDLKVAQNIYQKAALGHQPMLVDWYPYEDRYCLYNLPIMNAYIDPAACWIDDAAWAGFDYVMDLEAAKRRWPKYAKDLDRAKQTGVLSDRSRYDSFASVFRDTDFQRPVVTIRTMYRRHVAYPMTPDEALAKGRVAL